MESSHFSHNQIKDLGYDVPADVPPPKAALARVTDSFHELPSVPVAEAGVPEGFSPNTVTEPTHVRVMDGATAPDGLEATCVSYLGSPDRLTDETQMDIRFPNGARLRVDRIAAPLAPANYPEGSGLSETIADAVNDARQKLAPVALLDLSEPPEHLADCMTVEPREGNMNVITVYDEVRGIKLVYQPTSNIEGEPGVMGRNFTETAYTYDASQPTQPDGAPIVVIGGSTRVRPTPPPAK